MLCSWIRTEDDQYASVVGRVRGTALQVDSTYIKGRRRWLWMKFSALQCQNRGVHSDGKSLGRQMTPVHCHAVQSCTYTTVVSSAAEPILGDDARKIMHHVNV